MRSVAVGRSGTKIIAGEESGRIHILNLKRCGVLERRVTPVRLWLFQENRWDESLTARCTVLRMPFFSAGSGRRLHISHRTKRSIITVAVPLFGFARRGVARSAACGGVSCLWIAALVYPVSR